MVGVDGCVTTDVVVLVYFDIGARHVEFVSRTRTGLEISEI